MSNQNNTPLPPLPLGNNTTPTQAPKKQKIDLKRANYTSIAKMNSNMNIVNETAEAMFATKRLKWADILNPIFEKLATRNPIAIMDAQSECLAIRTSIQSDISTNSAHLTKAYVAHKNAFADRMEYYMTGFGVKTNITEKVHMVDRDLAEAKRRTLLIENYIEFLKEYRRSCDQVAFSITNIIALMKYTE